MPRLPRVHLNGVLYYLTQQGTPDRPLFRDSEDCATYLDLLCQYKTKHEFRLFGWALNEDKIHLLVEPYGNATISEIMRDLTSRYSKFSNGRYGGAGSLFKGRFHNVMLEKELLLIPAMRWVRTMKDLSTAAVAGTTPLLVSMRAEIKEVMRKTGLTGEVDFSKMLPAMNSEEQEIFSKRLKDAVIGSPEFVSRVRGQIVEASERAHQENNGLHAHAAVAVQAAHSVNLPRWAFSGLAALACAAIILPASYFMTSKNQGKQVSPTATISAAKDATVRSLPKTVAADRNTLHASVIVLEGTAWNLRLIPSNKNGKADVEFDQISFVNDQVVSQKMAARGFQPTNYTITTNVDGSIVWETMQTGPNGEKVFWRGEWKEDGMHGVLSRQEVGGELKTFQFMGSR